MVHAMYAALILVAPQATAGGPGPMRVSLFNIVLPLSLGTHTHIPEVLAQVRPPTRRKPRSYHPHFQGGPGAASQVLVQSAYHTGRGVTQGRTLSPYSGPASMGATQPEDARVAIWANPGDLVKMAIPPPPTHTVRTELVER